MKVRRIEIEFAIPVELSDDNQRRLYALAGTLARATETPEIVHWAAGCGSKPTFSKSDAAFLGKEAEPDAPDSGEPTFDDSIFHIETCCRERYESEKLGVSQ